jgi:TRAP transporter TAXI family solute receptor
VSNNIKKRKETLMKKKQLSTILFGACLILIFAALGLTPAAAAEREGWPKHVIIAGTSLGGSNYTVAVAWADMMRKHLNVPATATTSGGSLMSIRLLQGGDIQMATCTGDTTFQAYRGIKPWKSKKDVSAIMWAHPVAWHWAVRAGKGYKTVKDIFEKATMQAYPWPASSTTELVFFSFMESVGFTLDQVKDRLRPLVSASDQVRNMKDRKVDAIMYGGAPETAQWVALSNEISLEFVGPSDKEIKWIHEKYPYFQNIPLSPGAYKGQDYGINTLAFRMGIVVSASMPESFVYKLTKNVFDNLDELHKYHKTYLKRWYTWDSMMNPLEVCPLHPGTVKYLKEKGKWTPKLQAMQKKQVALGDYPSRMPRIAGWKQ